ncbi:MAG: TlpA family protein disulfide reductase [Paucibacter sp.]|nr:TlpA family protein disulfide reductase [Roseateles sp.]
MLAVSVGPLSLPVAPLLLLLATGLASSLANYLVKHWLTVKTSGEPPSALATEATGAIWGALAPGLLAARIAFVALHAEAYLATPWALLDVRDGGWHAGAGALGGAAYLLWRSRKTPALRRTLLTATLIGAGFWQLGSWLTALPQARAMPAIDLLALNSGKSTNIEQVMRSAQEQGRPVVLNLWASWCGPCRAEMPMLQAAQQREQDVDFIFVNQGESAAAVQAYLDAQKLQLANVYLDGPSNLGPALGSRGLPSTLFYSSDGRLHSAHMGVLNAAALASKLQDLQRQ